MVIGEFEKYQENSMNQRTTDVLVRPGLKVKYVTSIKNAVDETLKEVLCVNLMYFELGQTFLLKKWRSTFPLIDCCIACPAGWPLSKIFSRMLPSMARKGAWISGCSHGQAASGRMGIVIKFLPLDKGDLLG